MWLIVRNIRVNVQLGIYNWEKVIKRLVIIEAKINAKKIIDYDSIILKIKEFVSLKEFNYIEDLSKAITGHLMKNFDIQELSLTISKPNIMNSYHYAEINEVSKL